MYSGICICLLLAVLSLSSSGQQTLESHNGNPVATNLEKSLTDNHRNARSPSSGRSIQRMDGNADQRANLGALLAKYLQQARRGILNISLHRCSLVLNKFPFIHEKIQIGIRMTSSGLTTLVQHTVYSTVQLLISFTM